MKGGFLEHSDDALSLALSPDAKRSRKGHWKALEKISHSLTHFLSLLFSLQKVSGEGQSHTAQLGQGLPSAGFSAEEKVSSSCSGFSILDVRKRETTERVEHFFIFWRTGAVSRPEECEAVLGRDGTLQLPKPPGLERNLQRQPDSSPASVGSDAASQTFITAEK